MFGAKHGTHKTNRVYSPCRLHTGCEKRHMLGYVCIAIKINHEIWHVVPPVSGSVLRVPPHNCGARGLGTKYITATWVRNPAHPERKEIAMVWRTGVGGATHSGFGEAGNERCGFYVGTWYQMIYEVSFKGDGSVGGVCPQQGWNSMRLKHWPRDMESAWRVFPAQMVWYLCMLVALNHNTFELPFTMVSRTSHANKRGKI